MDDCDGVIKYGVCIPAVSCSFVAYIPREYQCQFTKETLDCGDEEASISYTNYIFCNFNDNEIKIYLGILIFMFIAINYIWTLCNISDFLTPSLCHLSNVIGLSENFACVTVLAIGNSALDIITLIVGGTKSGPEMVMIYVLGKGLFVNTVVLSFVFLSVRFKMFPRSATRYSATYMLATAFLVVIGIVPIVYIWEAALYLVLYAVFVIIFIMRDWFYSTRISNTLVSTVADIIRGENQSKMLVVHRRSIGSMTPFTVPSPRLGRRIGTALEELEEDREQESRTFLGVNESHRSRPTMGPRTGSYHDYRRKSLMAVRENTTTLHRQVGPGLGEQQRDRIASIEGVYSTAPVPRRRKVLRKGAVNNALELERRRLLKLTGVVSEKDKFTTDVSEAFAVDIGGLRAIERSGHPFEDLCEHLNPIDDVEWVKASLCSKIIMLFEAPMLYACKLTIPCLDEAVLLNNWCKLLNCLHCILVPLVWLWAIDITKLPLSISCPIIVSTILAGFMLAVFVYLTSHANRAPRYHFLFAIAGIVSTKLLMYLCIKEIICVMYAFTNVFGIRKGWCYCVFLPWGNTASQIVNTITLTRSGFPRIAFAGCVGCSIYVMLVGLGVSWIYLLFTHGVLQFKYEPEYSGIISIEMFYLLACTFFTWVILATFSFECRKSLGWFLIILYTMFLLLLCACELDLISPLLLIS